MTKRRAQLDAYPTPINLADRMVDAVERRDVRVVVDPAAGDGALLAAAARRWTNATLVGADLDPDRRQSDPTPERPWRVHTLDLLDPVDRSMLLAEAGYSLSRCVLLNPPFSYRGGRYWQVELNGKDFRVTRAMAFLLSSLDLVGDDGDLVALVPAGLLCSERDRRARDYLDRVGKLTELRRNSPRSFRGAVTATAMVRWRPRGATLDPIPPPPRQSFTSPRLGRISVVRGTRQMHTVGANGTPQRIDLVHTTALRDNRLRTPLPRVALLERDRLIRGPAVLLPRVGAPGRRKIVPVARGEFVLSDCVYALVCTSADDAERLTARLARHFDSDIAPAYSGTGAPYLILERLIGLLTELGYDVHRPT